mmetsp:Transcript_95794/g.256017  ORF Transcript_95794/g.256017 Transcript_95794/m.256017 type:complete len:253 (-) Transcript_95794:4-762(-)
MGTTVAVVPIDVRAEAQLQVPSAPLGGRVGAESREDTDKATKSGSSRFNSASTSSGSISRSGSVNPFTGRCNDRNFCSLLMNLPTVQTYLSSTPLGEHCCRRTAKVGLTDVLLSSRLECGRPSLSRQVTWSSNVASLNNKVSPDPLCRLAINEFASKTRNFSCCTSWSGCESSRSTASGSSLAGNPSTLLGVASSGRGACAATGEVLVSSPAARMQGSSVSQATVAAADLTSKVASRGSIATLRKTSRSDDC